MSGAHTGRWANPGPNSSSNAVILSPPSSSSACGKHKLTYCRGVVSLHPSIHPSSHDRLRLYPQGPPGRVPTTVQTNVDSLPAGGLRYPVTVTLQPRLAGLLPPWVAPLSFNGSTVTFIHSFIAAAAAANAVLTGRDRQRWVLRWVTQPAPSDARASVDTVHHPPLANRKPTTSNREPTGSLSR